jgi:hypothetical protein
LGAFFATAARTSSQLLPAATIRCMVARSNAGAAFSNALTNSSHDSGQRLLEPFHSGSLD